MRIWDIEPKSLCRPHLLGEHRELHALWNILAYNKRGYQNHPETKRWRSKLAALYKRHQTEVEEMVKRGYKHHSPLNKSLAQGSSTQDVLIDTIDRQFEILKEKKCSCAE